MGSTCFSVTKDIIDISFICLPYMFLQLLYSFTISFFILIFPVSPKSLEGEIILVTGCGSGIGKAVVLKLAKTYKNKVTLILWDYNELAVQGTANEVEKAGCSKVHAFTVDVSNHEQIAQTAETIRSQVGDVTVLINNAGVSHNRAFLNLSPEQIERTIKINCLAHLWTTKEFLPKMLEKNHGHIVATCSMGGIMAVRGNTPYYSSKFAVRAAMIALKDEVVQLYPDKTGINFTIVYPWFVKTPLIDNLDVQFRFPKLLKYIEADDVADAMLNGICYNSMHVVVPAAFHIYLWLESLFPENLRKKVRDFSFLEYRGTEDD